MDDPNSTTNEKFVNAIVRYRDEEGKIQEAIVEIDKNGDLRVEPFSGSEPCDSPTILPVTKDPLEQLAEQIQVAINQLSPPTSGR